MTTLKQVQRLRSLTVTLVERGELPAFHRTPRKQRLLERGLQRAIWPLLAGILEPLLDGLGNGSVRPAVAGQVDGALQDGVNGISDDLGAAMLNGHLASAQFGFERIAGMLRDTGIDLSWELVEPRAREILVEQGADASKLITERISRDAKRVLVEGFDEGLGTREIGDQLRELRDDLRASQAEAIARTEVHSAVLEGNVQAFDQGEVEYIQWITAADRRVRDSHIALHGNVIRRGERFANGLRYPGTARGQTGRVRQLPVRRGAVLPAAVGDRPGHAVYREGVMIIPAKHKCPRCGGEWRMLANVPNDRAPSYGKRRPEPVEGQGDGVTTKVCSRCESRGSR